MKNREKEINLVEEDNKQFVIADNDNPHLQRAFKLKSMMVARDRFAMFAKTQALGDEGSSIPSPAPAPASELWDEMPQLAREYEASRSDDDFRAEDALEADDWEFDQFGGVTA
jgi:hypothetical protein